MRANPCGARSHANGAGREAWLDADVLAVLELSQILDTRAVFSARVPDNPIWHVALRQSQFSLARLRDEHSVRGVSVHQLRLLFIRERNRISLLNGVTAEAIADTLVVFAALETFDRARVASVTAEVRVEATRELQWRLAFVGHLHNHPQAAAQGRR